MVKVRTLAAVLVFSAAAVWLSVHNFRTQTVQAVDGSGISLDPAASIPANFSGPDALARALNTGRATPLSMDAADLDGDGFSDLVASYSVNGSGAIAVFRGNHEAFAPRSQETLNAIARRQPPAPFLSGAQAFPAPARPDFLGLGNFSSSQTQIAMAARNSNTVYVLSRDASGAWQNVQSLAIDGGIDAMAVARTDRRQPWHQVFVSSSTPQGSKLLVYSGSDTGLQLTATYSIPAAITSFQFDHLDGNAASDAAIAAGGQLFLLHGSDPSTGLEAISLPYSVSQVAVGHFVFDRLSRTQMALVAADGSVHILAHESFDGRPLSPADIADRRGVSHARRTTPAAARPVLPREHWKEIENYGGIVSATSLATARVFGTHVSGYSADDLMVLDPISSTLSVIEHPNQRADGSMPAGSVLTRPEALHGMTAAMPQRVSTDGHPGVLLLRSDSPEVAVLQPHATFTYNVNIFTDPVPAPVSSTCNGNAGDCSLREAIIKANTNGSGSTNVINLQAGTYTLSQAGAGQTSALTGNLTINVSVTLNGQASNSTIDGAQLDKVFSINPTTLPGFTVAFNGLTIQNGQNPVSASYTIGGNGVPGNPFGGAFDFDSGSDGAGDLSLTDVIIQNNATTDGDGGGIALFNSGAGPGLVTITNCTIRSNRATESTTGGAGQGGGIWMGTNAVVSVANTSIDSNNIGGTTGSGFGGGIYISGPGGKVQNTITGGEINSNNADFATATGQGGGIWTSAGITITGALIQSNRAGSDGGGIYTDAQGELTTLSQINFQSNSVTGAGGAGGAIEVGSPAFPTTVNLSYCRLYQNTATTAANINNVGTATVTATPVWWGQNSVTGNSGGVQSTPFIVLTNTASPNSIIVNQTSNLTASFLQDSNNNTLSATNLTALTGLPLTFQNPVRGSLSNQQTFVQNGTGTATFTGTAFGTGTADVVVDSATVTSNNITIAQGSTTTTVVSSPNPSVYGQTVTVTATVTPGLTGPTTPGGTVTIKEGTNTVCTTSALSAGSAACSTSTLAPGSHTLTAVYAGDTNFTGSSGSLTSPQVVNMDNTTTALTSAPNPSVFGQSVTFTATVSANAPGGGIPTGQVTFLDTGNLPLGTVNLNGSGVATFTTSALTVGNHSITSSYNGDPNFSGNTGTLSGTPQVVSKGSTTTLVTSSANPATDTQTVTFTATVSAAAPATGIPTGTVTFLDGGNSIGTGNLNPSGVATFSTSSLALGNHTITTTYPGDGNFTGSAGSLSTNPQVITPGPATHFTVTAPGTATAGTAFNFTVTALDALNNTATGYTGTVHFTSTDGQAVLPANSTLTNGVGTFSATLKTSGNRTITATDTNTGTITGASPNIVVSPATVTHFSFTTPGTATAGTAFNFTISALDQFNNSATGYTGTVHFTSSDGAAVLPANSTLTNGTGSFSATLKTTGSQTITATDSTTSSITATSSTIVVTAASGTHFVVLTPASATAGTAFSFTVTALDQFNNTATGYSGTVHFTSTDNSAVLPANSTLSNGVGTFSATLKTAGSQGITATDTGNATITGTNTTTVSPASATHFSVSAPAGATAGLAFNFTVTALDQFNNTATSYGGTVHFSSSDTLATLPANSTLANGTGTFSATLKTLGPETITAVDTVSTTIAGTSSVTVASAVATHLIVSAPATANAGGAFNFTVTALDQFNNVASAYSGIVHFTSTDSQAVLPANSTLTGGTGTFSATLKTAGSKTITAADTVTGTITGTSAAIAVSATAATHLSVSAPAAATAGTAFNFTVTALDQFNNVAAAYSGTIHFTSTDGAAVLPANSTLTNSTGTFSATLKTSGTQSVTATDTVTSTIAGTSSAITVSSASATHFSLSAPGNTTAGATFNFTVTALDVFNNVATGYAGTVHFTSTDGQAVLPANSTLTNGSGTFSATLKTSGAQTIAATDTASSSITGMAAITVAAGSNSLHFVVSAPANATAGTPFSFTVTAADQFNNMVPGYSGTVTFSSNDTKAALPGNSSIAGGAGTFSATLKTAGARTISVVDTANPSIQGTSSSIAVAAGPPVTFTVTGGSPQSAPLNASFPSPLAVTVLDAFGNPVQGLTITYTAPGSGPSATFSGASTGNSDPVGASMAARPDLRRISRPSPDITVVTATAITNPQGVASVSATANGVSGTYAVTASYGTNLLYFYLTNAIQNPPALNAQITPGYLTLRYQQASAGAAPNPAVGAQLTINGAFPSTYTAVTNVPWLTVNPPSAPTTAVVTAMANGASLAPAIYSANIIFTFGDNSEVIVPVQLQVVGPPLIKPDLTALSFTAQAGSTMPQSQSFYMRSAGADFAGTLTTADVSGNGGSWLTVTPASFSTPAQIQATVNPTGLAAGVYQKNIVVTAPATNSPFTISVTFTITPTAPAIAVTSLVNAASFATGPVAPNTIVTAFGTFPGCASNAQATVDGAAVSVFYSSATQISLLLPASVAGEATAQLQISCAGVTAAPLPVPIAAATPALFTVPQNGTGQADVVNQNGTVDTPSPAGTVIQLYGTGFGLYNPPSADGLMRLAQTVTASVGGAPAQVLYAGQAPGNTLGLQQIDILIPAGAASGATLPLQLTIGGVTTQTGVTLAIQ